MKKHIITAGLFLSLSGLTALAQTSTTPGTPVPSDPNRQGMPTPEASTPPTFPTDRDSSTDQDHTRDRTSTDHQQYPDAQPQDQSTDSVKSDRDSQRTDSDRGNRLPQSDEAYPPQQEDRDRSQSERGDRDQASTDDYRNQIQSALRQANLNGVMVNDTGSRVELNGTVSSSHDHKQAMGIAESYAHGRKVVDHIKVEKEHGGRDHDNH